jgi:hypothetical protein
VQVEDVAGDDPQSQLDERDGDAELDRDDRRQKNERAEYERVGSGSRWTSYVASFSTFSRGHQRPEPRLSASLIARRR